MLRDVTGCILIPGNQGMDCPANGMDAEEECCCEECDYLLCCTDMEYPKMCRNCTVWECPRRM